MCPGMWNNGRFMGHLDLDINSAGRERVYKGYCYTGRIGERINIVFELLEEDEEDETERYIIMRKLGLGNNSNAWLVRDMRMQMVVALKILHRNLEHVTELTVLRKISWRKEQPALCSPGLEHLIGFIEDIVLQHPFSRQHHAAFVMEPLTISLEGLVQLLRAEHKDLPLAFIKKKASGMLKGLTFLHEDMNLIFAGCKPGNLMFRLPNMQHYIQEEMWRDPASVAGSFSTAVIQPIGMSLWKNAVAQEWFFENAVIVMTDFGRSQWQHKQENHVVLNRRMYAPEIVIKGAWGKPIDIWCFGTTTTYMILEDYLFSSDDRDGAIRDFIIEIGDFCPQFVEDFPQAREIVHCMTKQYGRSLSGYGLRSKSGYRLRSKLKHHLPKELVEKTLAFLTQCFTLRPAARPTARELLIHPWLAPPRVFTSTKSSTEDSSDYQRAVNRLESLWKGAPTVTKTTKLWPSHPFAVVSQINLKAPDNDVA